MSRRRYTAVDGSPLPRRQRLHMAVEDTLVEMHDRPRWLLHPLYDLHRGVERAICLVLGHEPLECGNYHCTTGWHCAYCDVRLSTDSPRAKVVP